MPDQHAAATEHDLITTIAEPLAKLPDNPLAVVSVDFPVALRGYDRIAVDAYVERTAQLVAELQATRSPEAAVRRALERVGEEIAGILQRAHDTADEITARSRSEAEERLETARREAAELTAAAERQVKDLDAETERIWAERHGVVIDAKELARRLTELADAALARFPAAPPPAEPSASVAAPPFDGALELPTSPVKPEDLAAEADPALQTPTEAFRAPGTSTPAESPSESGDSTPGHSESVDCTPTLDMPPIEPWEGDPGPFNAGTA